MENHVDQADICELAHIYTVEECKRRKIELDENRASDDEDIEYSEQAQEVFDRHYKLITETLSV